MNWSVRSEASGTSKKSGAADVWLVHVASAFHALRFAPSDGPDRFGVAARGLHA